MLDGIDLGEGGGDAADRSPSWCTVFLLGHWMTVSLPAAEGSPPPTPKGRRRSSHGRRHNLRPPRLSFTISSSPQAWKIPAVLRDKCFNCLSYLHRVTTCRLPLRCHGYRHLARDRKWPRSAKSATKGATRHDTLLVATLRPPRRHAVVRRARMGPRIGPWGAPTAPAVAAAATDAA
jgi:hypothetical protein